jgi:hypothetical protein
LLPYYGFGVLVIVADDGFAVFVNVEAQSSHVRVSDAHVVVMFDQISAILGLVTFVKEAVVGFAVFIIDCFDSYPSSVLVDRYYV